MNSLPWRFEKLESIIGKDIVRIEAKNKVTGTAKYCDDLSEKDSYHAVLLTSPHAHAAIVSIDCVEALQLPGVKAILTGKDSDVLCGTTLEDRPPLAREKVRYFGEPVALVIADNVKHAKLAVNQIKVNYQQLPVINHVFDAIKENPVLLHEDLMTYQKAVVDVYPEANTNICNRVKIRKGDMNLGWSKSEVIVEGRITLPQSDHAAMETRCAQCYIDPDGYVTITTSSQSPYYVKELICKYFKVAEGNIIVKVPLVGGGFGGKAAIFLEILV